MKFRTSLPVAFTFLILFESGCAPKRTYTAVPVPEWEYVRSEFPDPPQGLSPGDRSSFEQGWDALLSGDLERAARDLDTLSRKYRDNGQVQSALGFLELRVGDLARAENLFSSALQSAPSLSAAQVGLVLIAIARNQEEAVFDRLRALKRDHPQHVLVERYLSDLQLKLAESKLRSARALKDEKRYTEAVAEYREALRIAPDAAGLYSEAAGVELADGQAESAAEHAARALEIGPATAELYRLQADALRASGRLEPAVESYRKAMELRPDDPTLASLYEDARRELEREALPAQYADIPKVERITREQLAAVLYVRLRPWLDAVSERVQVIATDIGESWAGEFIREVVSAGILDVFANHTFQPEAFVRRVDLAKALWASLTTLRPEQSEVLGPKPSIEDVLPDNLNYDAVALVVSLGLLPTDERGRFEPLRLVSGEETVTAVEALARRLNR